MHSVQITTEEKILGEKFNEEYSKPRISTTQGKIADSVTAKEKDPTVQLNSTQDSSPAVYFGFALEPRSQKRIDEVANQIGRKFPILMAYIQWGNSYNKNLDESFFNVFNNNNLVPLITWEPWDPSKGVNQPDYKLANITAGNFDAYIKQAAQGVKVYGKPVFLRFAHEMNGNWYPWGGTVNGNTPSDYINAWKHVRSIFDQQGVTNVTWVWSPNSWSVPYVNGNQPEDYFPGNDMLDWVGLDGYNFGTSRFGSVWDSFGDLFSAAYHSMTSLTNKPIMIAETSSTEEGGNKADWIKDALTVQIPYNFPRVKAVIWFNINKETNWDIASSPSSLSALKSAFNTPTYTNQIRSFVNKIIQPQ